jgi:hypothetical protein
VSGIVGAVGGLPVGALLLPLAELVVALGATELTFRVLLRTRRPWVRALSRALTRHCWWPARVLVVALIGDLTLRNLRPPIGAQAQLEQLLGLLLIAWWRGW